MFNVLSIFETQVSQIVCVSYHRVLEHNLSNHVIPISALLGLLSLSYIGLLFLFFFNLLSKQIICQRCDKKKRIGPTETQTQALSRFVLALNLLS